MGGQAGQRMSPDGSGGPDREKGNKLGSRDQMGVLCRMEGYQQTTLVGGPDGGRDGG